MAAVTLQDQLGAMALVDDLRHRARQVQEHLNLPARRQEVATRIRDYYTSNDIPFDEEIIEQGVRMYFDQRLTFEAPKQSLLQRFGAHLIMQRRVIGLRSLYTALAITIGGAGLWSANAGIQAIQNSSVASLAAEARSGTAALMSEIERQDRELAALKAQYGGANIPQAELLTVQAENASRKARTLLDTAAIPKVITASNRDQTEEKLERYESDFDTAKALLSDNRGALLTIDALYATTSEFQKLVASQEYKVLAAQYSPIKEREGTVRQAMASVRAGESSTFVTPFQDLKRLLALAGPFQALEVQHATILGKLKGAGFAEADMEIVYAFSTRFAKALREMDQAAASTAVVSMEKLLEFGLLPLQLHVSNRSGVKSGFAAKYKETGGPSWWLVVEAIDSAGGQMEVPVRDIISGEVGMATHFAVRVPEDVYLQVREDKKDGIVNDSAMGEKLQQSLKLNFDQERIEGQPSLLLNW